MKEQLDALAARWPAELTRELAREELRQAMDQLWAARRMEVHAL